MEETMGSAMKAYLLRGVPQLRQMADEYFDHIRARVEEVHFKKWEVILSKGQEFDSVYVLEKGKVMEHDGEAADLMYLPGETTCWPGDRGAGPKCTPGEQF